MQDLQGIMADDEEQQSDVPEVEFALTPGQAGDTIIDYKFSTGLKLYKSATKPLETKHDLSAEKLQSFLDSLEQRAIERSWSAIIDAPNEEEGARAHLTQRCGSVTLKQVRAHVEVRTRLSQSQSNAGLTTGGAVRSQVTCRRCKAHRQPLQG